jgi:hypothetical protein
MITISQPPALDIDKWFANHGHPHISANGRLERRIVWNLIQHLEAAGFRVHQTFDSDTFEYPADAKAAMELVFNLDEVSLRFLHKDAPAPKRPASDSMYREDYEDGDWHGVLLVLGNGEDIICDWNYNSGDTDGFNAAVEAFSVEACF